MVTFFLVFFFLQFTASHFTGNKFMCTCNSIEKVFTLLLNWRTTAEERKKIRGARDHISNSKTKIKQENTHFYRAILIKAIFMAIVYSNGGEIELQLRNIFILLFSLSHSLSHFLCVYTYMNMHIDYYVYFGRFPYIRNSVWII